MGTKILFNEMHFKIFRQMEKFMMENGKMVKRMDQDCGEGKKVNF